MPRCVIVSHFHWDREWYRPFEGFRARLVDAVDRVLDLLDADPGYHFLLDGQTILLDDYLAIRPERRADLERGLRQGRLAAGPWYVQPDSLLPSGEAHVRNLLQGRRTGAALGPVSHVGYVPDSFGHPAQLPQILAGFGISSFVYWRGNGSEIDGLGPAYRWQAADGSTVEATLLREGYFNAACLPADTGEAARGLAEIARRLAGEGVGPVLLMNGIDHMLPDASVGAAAEALAEALGGEVKRGLLEDVVGRAAGELPTYRGELTGARLANLLAGVWSTHMPIKLANRRCEALLEGWAEPWAALGRRLGLADERPSLRLAWRSVLQNQAHDSLCGCSIDAVTERVRSRYDEADGIARETVTRLLERLAGLGVERRTPWTVEQEIAVFNPSPEVRTDVVRVALDTYPAMRLPLGVPELPPLMLAGGAGFTVDGRPARLAVSRDATRTRWLPGQEPLDLEFIATDVPAFGWRRFHLAQAESPAEEVDAGRDIEIPGLRVSMEEGGTLALRCGEREYRGLLAIEDRGDRGDSYDFDAVDGDFGARLESVTCVRRRHASGIARLEVRRVLRVPAGLDESRECRSQASVPLEIVVEARLAPGVPRLDLVVRADNTARDHRLRLLFPTADGGPTGGACRGRAASTFDVVARSSARPDDAGWLHPAPTTFVQQGFVSANGLTIAAPGLPEAEIAADGTVAITLLRAVGWLARFDLRSRPIPAGPAMPAPAAQVQGVIEAHLALFAGDESRRARHAELGLRGVFAGAEPPLQAGASLLALEGEGLLLSALKPAEEGEGIVVRVLNPTEVASLAALRLGFPFSSAAAVRLDEEPVDLPVTVEAQTIRFEVPAHGLRSVLVR